MPYGTSGGNQIFIFIRFPRSRNTRSRNTHTGTRRKLAKYGEERDQFFPASTRYYSAHYQRLEHVIQPEFGSITRYNRINRSILNKLICENNIMFIFHKTIIRRMIFKLYLNNSLRAFPYLCLKQRGERCTLNQ